MDNNLIMPFGKYKGIKVNDVPYGYLLYLYDRKKLTGPIKKFAEENIPILRLKAQNNQNKDD